MHKKERSVVGQTNRTPVTSPRRGAPAGGSLSATLLASVRDCETTMSSKHSQSPRGRSPRVVGSNSSRTAAASGGWAAAPSVGDARETAAVHIKSSPRRDSATVVETNGSRSASLVRGVSDVARMHGMRALLFDALDTTSAVQPPIPEAPQANTRFSAAVLKDTFPMVQPKPGSTTFADAEERFQSKGACHLDALLCKADQASTAQLASARANHARVLQQHQVQCIAEAQLKWVQQDLGRIEAKSMQQQKYAATRKEKGTM